jgi:hypothetical protein
MCRVVWHGRVVGKASMFGMKKSMASLAAMAFSSKMRNIIRLKREKKKCAICEYVLSSKIGETPY